MSDLASAVESVRDRYRNLVRELLLLARGAAIRNDLWVTELYANPLVMPSALTTLARAHGLDERLAALAHEMERSGDAKLLDDFRTIAREVLAPEPREASVTSRAVPKPPPKRGMTKAKPPPRGRGSTRSEEAEVLTGNGGGGSDGATSTGAFDDLLGDEDYGRGPFTTETYAGGLLGGDPIAPPAAAAPPAPVPSPPAPPEQRWMNAEIADQEPDDPLELEQEYVLEFGVDVKRAAGAVSVRVPDAELLMTPDQETVTLTIQLDSRDFDIAQPTQNLVVPRRGKSKGKARFDIIPKQAGRGVITATVHKGGNFLLQMELSYSVGAVTAEPAAVVSHGRTLDASTSLQPRDLSFCITPGRHAGYDCIVYGPTSTRVELPITQAELADAVNAVRKALMDVVMWRSTTTKQYVFQTSIDIPDADRDAALKTLSTAGGRLFQRLFFHPAAGASTKTVGQRLRERATEPGVRLNVQIVAEHFPVPWGLLYLGDIADDAPRDWELFLGMRHIVELIPLQTDLSVPDCTIVSDKPSLAVSVNVNAGIDKQMKADFVDRQQKFFRAASAKLGMRLVEREARKEMIDALKGKADDQVMYLYCHAVTVGIDDPGGIDSSSLVLSGEESLTLKDLNANAPMDLQLKGNPLVFINACESAELSPMFYDGFVPYFMAKGARGVVGTECKMPALFATEWALRFFPEFLGGAPLGEVFLELRRELWQEHGNPLGLLYAVYCDGDTQVAPALGLT